MPVNYGDNPELATSFSRVINKVVAPDVIRVLCFALISILFFTSRCDANERKHSWLVTVMRANPNTV
jgi:hypothetical protein